MSWRQGGREEGGDVLSAEKTPLEKQQGKVRERRVILAVGLDVSGLLVQFIKEVL